MTQRVWSNELPSRRTGCFGLVVCVMTPQGHCVQSVCPSVCMAPAPPTTCTQAPRTVDAAPTRKSRTDGLPVTLSRYDSDSVHRPRPALILSVWCGRIPRPPQFGSRGLPRPPAPHERRLGPTVRILATWVDAIGTLGRLSAHSSTEHRARRPSGEREKARKEKSKDRKEICTKRHRPLTPLSLCILHQNRSRCVPHHFLCLPKKKGINRRSAVPRAPHKNCPRRKRIKLSARKEATEAKPCKAPSPKSAASNPKKLRTSKKRGENWKKGSLWRAPWLPPLHDANVPARATPAAGVVGWVYMHKNTYINELACVHSFKVEKKGGRAAKMPSQAGAKRGATLCSTGPPTRSPSLPLERHSLLPTPCPPCSARARPLYSARSRPLPGLRTPSKSSPLCSPRAPARPQCHPRRAKPSKNKKKEHKRTPRPRIPAAAGPEIALHFELLAVRACARSEIVASKF
ncbi:hypothetical protein K438DRAFT_704536 [Mycena galopus ATCC 62051]|nr:hypothetical protein K438DRAFT_704536 [Mycena galopus ATCC 62051]